MKRSLVIGTLMVLGLGGVALAGVHERDPVYVDTSSYPSGQGTVGDPRSSVDTHQYIGCSATSYASGGSYASCSATDANGKSAYCYTYNADLRQAVLGIKGDSYVAFFGSPSGQCTTIIVSNGSSYAPKR
jgi:hypothetical protein